MSDRESEQQKPISVLVVGLGLIGGSFAAALKAGWPAVTIIGWDSRQEVVEQALRLGVIDAGCATLHEGVKLADVVQLAVPMLAMAQIVATFTESMLQGRVVTDVGSSKGVLVSACREVFGRVPNNFVLAHPIAGSEKSGLAAISSDLFRAHKVILTPMDDTSADAQALVRSLWCCCGAEVTTMTVEKHDEVLALTSHLPHLLAFSLVDTLASDPDNQDIFRFAAGGFRDFTRIAGSDPRMWHDVAFGNRRAILAALDRFASGLESLRGAIEKGDGQAVQGTFERASTARRHFGTLLERRAYMNRDDKQQKSKVTLVAGPGGEVSGTVRVPGDKSISHRSIMLGALAEGDTVVEGVLEGEDAMATLQAFRDMGVNIEGPYDGRLVIHGVGMYGLKPPPGPLYLGNAGTAMRLLAGLLAAQPFDVTLTGDLSLSGRPMMRVVEPLRKMGAVIETAENGRPPLVIRGGRLLRGITSELPVASAQVQSCLLLAGLYADGVTDVNAPGVVRDHTQRMLTGFGYEVESENSRAVLKGGGSLSAASIEVPADISSAAFFMVAASITEGADLTLTHVGINPTRTGVIDILRLMGADVTVTNETMVGGEPVADISVRHASLRGVEIPPHLVPLAIDEFPVLFVAAACAEGETLLRGATELRVKESDRIQAMADGLKVLGVDVQTLPDGMRIKGGTGFSSGEVDSHGDHRIAMAFAVASLRSSGAVTILDCANVATSFPGFVDLAQRVGFNIQQQTVG